MNYEDWYFDKYGKMPPMKEPMGGSLDGTRPLTSIDNDELAQFYSLASFWTGQDGKWLLYIGIDPYNVATVNR